MFGVGSWLPAPIGGDFGVKASILPITPSRGRSDGGDVDLPIIRADFGFTPVETGPMRGPDGRHGQGVFQAA